MTHDDKRETVTLDEAIAMLPDGDCIHTFRNTTGILLGADWPRDSIVAALRDASEIQLTGALPQSMHHNIAIDHGGRFLFIETRRKQEVAP